MKRYSLYYISCLTFILIGLGIMLSSEKGEATLYLNNLQSNLMDTVFRYLTLLGEWFGLTMVAVILLFRAKLKYFVILIIAFTVSTVSAQLLKTQVFPDNKRPSAHFEQVRAIDGVELHKNYSFPSGHTTAAFSAFAILALAMRSKAWQLIGFAGGVLTAVSRMYLGQHYLMDVIAGACLGIFVSSAIFFSLDNRMTSKALNKRLIKGS